MTDHMEGLRASIATQSTGFAVVTDGVLDIRTVCDTERRAALCGLQTMGFAIAGCTDETCNCSIKALQAVSPDSKVVPVTVKVS